ncbi:MAG: TetR/AcrR family transcriptional regulator [Oscillospiraceae bacterium]
MNSAITSREEILRVCRGLIAENGLAALNMREVARSCGVALGSLYNYFPSKSELAIAAIESVWQEIFRAARPCSEELPFPERLRSIFDSVSAGMVEYPNFFTAHSIGFVGGEKGEARKTMERYLLHMKNGLLEALKRDSALRRDAFDAAFTPEALVDFAVSGLLTLLMRREDSCEVLLELIRRSIY